MDDGKAILVVGSTGKTGSRVVAGLDALGLPVRHGVRSAERPFDWNDPSGWDHVLEGIGAVYLTYYPDIAAPGAPEAIEAFAIRARAAGARRIVLLSGRGEHEAQRAEELLKATGVDWTILRSAWFSQNLSEGFLVDGIREGAIVIPGIEMPEPFVDVLDIADVAVAALTEPGHEGQLYELTGPRLLSFEQVVAEIAAETARDIRVTRVPEDAYAQALKAQGLDEGYVSLIVMLLTEVLDGRNASLADGVQRALGRPATDFSDYVRRTAATGVWAEA